MHLARSLFPYLRWPLLLLAAWAVLTAAGERADAAPLRKNDLKSLPTIQLKVDRQTFKTYVVWQEAAQTLGLSNIEDQEFSRQDALLFAYAQRAPRRFWMKDTFFNLDIIFFDEQGKIIGTALNMPANRERDPGLIPTTATYQAQYVLETKAGAYPWKIGQQLSLPQLLAPTKH